MEKTSKKKVLFICTHNSARSQMAEGILRSLYPEKYDVCSAGIEPTEIDPYAVKVMDEIGIDISSHTAKNIKVFIDEIFDYVVTVCDQAKESCPFFPGRKIIHKSFPDPSQVKGSETEILEGFRVIRDEIMAWVASAFMRET
ncbi:MAG: arsenate reductase ArsC [Candidatus Aminicenantes bacterium]|nr:MAG: arsenate reductase ArsC [Candidatus Aminicenantes bacterium]